MIETLVKEELMNKGFIYHSENNLYKLGDIMVFDINEYGMWFTDKHCKDDEHYEIFMQQGITTKTDIKNFIRLVGDCKDSKDTLSFVYRKND